MLRNFLSAVILLFSFIFLLMSCAICQSTYAQDVNSPQSPDALVIFNSEKNFKNGVSAKTYESFTSPSLSFVNNVLVVFAQAKDGEKCDIVEGYFDIKGDGSLDDKDKAEWKKRVTANDAGNKCAENPTTVADKDNIYLFFKNSDGTDSNIEYQIIKSGTPSNINDNKGITWGSPEDLIKKKNFGTVESEDISSISSGGSGIVVNENFVVPVWYTDNKKESFVSIITKKITPADSTEWDFVSNETPVEGIYPAVVKWKEKLIMVTFNKKEGLHKVYESSDMGKRWTTAVGSLSNMWGSTKEEKLTPSEPVGKNSFITAKINNSEEENVMLFTTPVKKGQKYDLHLLMSDYQRVHDVGAVATGSEKNPSSTLLFAEKNLFAAYEMWKTNKATINVMYLKDQLATIKKMLEKWTKQDEELSKFCFADDGTLKSGGACTDDNKIPTNGLVGFLSDNNNNKTHWNDKYFCVNATLKPKDSATITDVTNGLQFSGAGAGATWPVGEQGQNQLYRLVSNAFTLLAAVKIDGKTNKKANSVLGIRIKKGGSNNEIIGLWCTNEGKWGVGEQEESLKEQTHNEKCDKDKMYQVAFVFENKNLFLYVDGKKLEGLSTDLTTIPEQLSIENIYFGADNNAPTATSDVTIKNVLLYNRPFNESEVEKLKPKKIERTTQVISQGKDNEILKSDGGTTNTNTSLPTPGTQTPTENEKEEQPSSPPPTTEDSAARVGVVGVLCFMLFGVFTLLGRYVY